MRSVDGMDTHNVHIHTKILAPSHQESARPTIDNIEQFFRGSGSSTASVSVSGPSILTVGSIKPHNASERFTAPHTVSNSFPSYPLPFQKERKQKRKEEKPPKTLENTRKKGKSRHRSSCNSANASGFSLG